MTVPLLTRKPTRTAGGGLDRGHWQRTHHGLEDPGLIDWPAQRHWRFNWLADAGELFAGEHVDDALAAASKGNGKIYEDAHHVSDYGRFAVIADPENAPLLLIEPGKKPLGQGRDHGSWVWAELWTDDVEKAAAFYGSVIGVEHGTTKRGGEDYHIFTSAEKPCAGIIKIPPELERVEPGWAPYVAVSDLNASLAQVKELGGRVVFGGTDHPADASVALIIDPSGAALFLYQIGSSGGAR